MVGRKVVLAHFLPFALVAIGLILWVLQVGNATLFRQWYAPEVSFWVLITHLGDSLVLSGILLWVVQSRTLGEVLAITLTITITGLLAQLFKNTLFDDWVRPASFFTGLEFPEGTPRKHSFPSGHATTAMTAAVIYAYYRPYWGTLGMLLGALISYSRVAVGAHFPLDIAVGGLMGILLTAPLFPLLKNKLSALRYKQWAFSLKVLVGVLGTGQMINLILG